MAAVVGLVRRVRKRREEPRLSHLHSFRNSLADETLECLVDGGFVVVDDAGGIPVAFCGEADEVLAGHEGAGAVLALVGEVTLVLGRVGAELRKNVSMTKSHIIFESSSLWKRYYTIRDNVACYTDSQTE